MALSQSKHHCTTVPLWRKVLAKSTTGFAITSTCSSFVAANTVSLTADVLEAHCSQSIFHRPASSQQHKHTCAGRAASSGSMATLAALWPADAATAGAAPLAEVWCRSAGNGQASSTMVGHTLNQVMIRRMLPPLVLCPWPQRGPDLQGMARHQAQWLVTY